MNPLHGVGTQMQQTAQTQPSPRLVRAAREFEAQMMKELLKPLNAGNAEGEDGDEGSAGALGDFASEALGQAISGMGGFGIADRIVRQVAHSGNGSETAQVTGEKHFDTEMRRLQ